MSLELITAATTYPVTRAEAKLHARVDGSAEDALIDSYIAAATALVEQHTGRLLKAQTWKLWLDEFSPVIEFPKGPVTAVSSVQYRDDAGTLQTASASLYTLDLVSDPQWIVLNSGEAWPSTWDRPNAVCITFTAGLVTVPEPIRLAIFALITSWYETRAISGLTDDVAGGLRPYRRMVL